MKKKEEVLRILPIQIRGLMNTQDIEFSYLQAIRLRLGEPVLLNYGGKEFFLDMQGGRTKEIRQAYYLERKDLTQIIEYIGSYSLYAFEEELKQGFLTIPGGHRIGVAGKVVMEENHMKGLHHISYINIRISHEIKGCANAILPYLWKDGEVCNTLIISPPGCGKTTLLRDLIRQLSNGGNVGEKEYQGKNIGMVDERSELAGAYMGKAQNDVGRRTDVLDNCPKIYGMFMLLRSMAPDVICVDEIGDQKEIEAIETIISCGCAFLSTVHGSTIKDVLHKPLFQSLLEKKVFQRFIVLSKKPSVGSVAGIFNENGEEMKRDRKGEL